MPPKMTFLVSAYNRPHCLWVSLGCFLAQSVPEWEAVVLDNGPDPRHKVIVDSIGDPRISYQITRREPERNCYWSAEDAVNNGWATGEWICCPSDDSYYCPDFIEKMTTDSSLDLVYCDLLYDGRINSGKRKVLAGEPRFCHIDKTNFIVKRDKWIGFPIKEDPIMGPCADGPTVEEMVRRGYSHKRVDEILVVKNC